MVSADINTCKRRLQIDGIDELSIDMSLDACLGSRAREDVAERLIDRVERIGTMWCGCRGRPLMLVAMQCRLAMPRHALDAGRRQTSDRHCAVHGGLLTLECARLAVQKEAVSSRLPSR